MTDLARTDELFFTRAGLDRARIERIVGDALTGADDGELFLEYSQSESPRLRRRPAEERQLRHHPGLRPARHRRRGGRLRPCLRAQRGRDPARRRHREGGPCRPWRQLRPCRRAAPTAASTPTTTRSALVPFERKVNLLAEIDAYARGQGPARAPGDGLALRRLAGGADPAAGRHARRRHPPAGAAQRHVVVGEGDRQETGSYGTGGRIGYDLYLDPATWQRGRRRGAAPGAGQSRLGPGAGRRDAGRARPGLARRPAARGDRPRARGRLQPQEDLGLRRPDGPAHRRPGRHRGRRRHDPRPARLAHHRRRGHADPVHHADRGRHPGRLHAGPPERPPDGHEADRQRPARELRPRPDAAHDQHLHAGRRRMRPRRSSTR